MKAILVMVILLRFVVQCAKKEEEEHYKQLAKPVGVTSHWGM